MLNALVVDDEVLAREELIELLEETGAVRIMDNCGNAIDALRLIHQLKPDVVFLDIKMPKITGMELLSMLDPETMPSVVFVTTFDDYAIKVFEDNGFDYLLKPVEPQRLRKTIAKLQHSHSQPNITAFQLNQLEQVPCIGHNRILLLPVEELEYAYSNASGVHVCTSGKDTITQLSLTTLEDKTPLLRCHRQYLVNPRSIREIRLIESGLAEIKTQSGKQIPISRRYLKPLKDKLGLS